MRNRQSAGDRIISGMIYAMLGLLSLCTIIPFLQVITISMSPSEVINRYGLHLIPTQFDFSGYEKVFQYQLIWQAYGNTIVRTALGTGISVLLYILGAYPLSKSYLPNRKFWTMMIIFTMYFNGGLVPSYILVSRTLHLQDTIWALVLPPAMSAFTLIVVRNFFMSIPKELEESAKIDGANDLIVLFRIIVPLSKPVLATITLWSLVYHWNSWFDCMLYISSESKYVLQYVLRLILLQGQTQDIQVVSGTYVNTDSMKMATLLVATLPIICTYPFLQKYFVKGVLIGSVKG